MVHPRAAAEQQRPRARAEAEQVISGKRNTCAPHFTPHYLAAEHDTDTVSNDTDTASTNTHLTHKLALA